MLGSGMNLVTTIIGFGLSAIFIVFVCTRLICGRLRRMESRQLLHIDSRVGLELAENRVHGLAPVLVAAIPTMEFHHEAFSSSKDEQCAICLSEYQEKEVLRIMPRCSHTFHIYCIDIWLRKQSTCPVCRLSVQDSFKMKHPRRPPHGPDLAFHTSENSTEHSTQWQQPEAGQHSHGNSSNHGNHEFVTVNIESAMSAEATGRS